MASVSASSYADDMNAGIDEVLARFTAQAPGAADGRVRIFCLGLADGRIDGTPAGCYLAGYAPEADDGRGNAWWTDYPAEAMTFESEMAAMACYRTQPRARPTRPDGLPNRPMTMFAITLQ
jgi:hypothetical protein